MFLEFLNWADYTVDISGAPAAGHADLRHQRAGQSGGLRRPIRAGAATWSKSRPPTKERYAQADFGVDLDGVIKRVQVGYKFRRHETDPAVCRHRPDRRLGPGQSVQPVSVPGNYLDGFNANQQMQ